MLEVSTPGLLQAPARRTHFLHKRFEQGYAVL